MATRRYEITAGPSKFDLMLALFEGKTVSFTLKGVKGQLESQVTGVVQYSHKPHPNGEDSYRIEGSLVANGSWYSYCEKHEYYDFRGFFDCRTRQGVMDFQATECWKEAHDREMDECHAQADSDEEKMWQEAEETYARLDLSPYDPTSFDVEDEECISLEDEGTPEDALCDFIEPSLTPVGAVVVNEDEDYDDPAWCDRCNKDIAFCSCDCEKCGKPIQEYGYPGERVCEQCKYRDVTP